MSRLAACECVEDSLEVVLTILDAVEDDYELYDGGGGADQPTIVVTPCQHNPKSSGTETPSMLVERPRTPRPPMADE